MNREELVLLTGIIRTENLDIILNSIIDTFPENLNITWVLIHDRCRARGNCNHIIERCKKYQKANQRFSWLYCPIEKGSKEKYGGTLFNAPLKWLKENWMKDKDPWVYILDDDNTLCPLMMEAIENDIERANSSNKTIIKYDMLYYGCGVNAPLNEEFWGLVTFYTKLTPYYAKTDPSQIVMKYSTIDEIGFYPEGYRYDYDLYFTLFNNGYGEKILFSTGSEKDIGLRGYETTHNAIVDKETKEKWGEIINTKDGAVCGTLMAASNGEVPQVFGLSREALKEIYNKYILGKDGK
jgi:hypothetical protein